MSNKIILTRRVFVAGLVVSACQTGGGGAPQGNGARDFEDTLGGNVQDVSAEGLGFMNNYRANAGLSELQVSEPCRAAAMHHALSMAYSNTLDHNVNDPRGLGQVATRLRHYNVALPHAENVNYGYQTVARSVDAWSQSPGHARNLMDPSYRFAGMAQATHPNSGGTIYYCSVYSA